MDEICLWGEKKKKTQYKQPDRRHTKACITSLFQRYLTSCAVGITSSTKKKKKKPGSWEPRGHPSMRAADLQTELSDYENTGALRNALKSTAQLQRFPMQLQRLCVHTHVHTQTTSVPPFIQGLQFLSFITSKDLTSDL